jgi:hypothetical protein|tara:strand:- start:312 stop:611 length:300 start_codon:yes stop_codon:yes gene_type:complete
MSDFDTVATAAPAKERPDLGAAFIATNKKSPQSYDLSGTIVVEGVKHRFGAYKQKASGKGKMPEGTEFFTFYRVELAEDETPGAVSAADTSFNPAELEA